MKVGTRRDEVQEFVKGKEIGFVPTMGALHEGHLSLVRESQRRGLVTVVSIFVNPTQFNNSQDFEKYPINLERDRRMLSEAGCDFVFIPEVSEIYRADDDANKYQHEFPQLEAMYEGAFRPGHFKGVAQVVHILFDIVKPAVAFFGEKDFQQLAVIRELVKQMQSDIKIVGLPTKREIDGLAMSSRNQRLTAEQRGKATLLFKSLTFAADHAGTTPILDIKKKVEQWFAEDPEVRLEYFDIIDPSTFESISDSGNANARAIISAYVGDVRLIDNMILK
jgi:pantoate--beta-alanine ligase